MGIDLRLENGNISVPDELFYELIVENFGQEGFDLVTWWLYEDVEHKIYEAGSVGKEYYYKGEKIDGKVVADLEDIDALYDYLVENYAVTDSQKWEPCTEENYPDIDEVCFVRFKDTDGYYVYDTLSKCSFGWNVLMRSNAECIKFKKDNN